MLETADCLFLDLAHTLACKIETLPYFFQGKRMFSIQSEIQANYIGLSASERAQ
jgi:hypothetical protein